MKTKDQIKPNYGPVYAAAMYPDLCKIFQKHGYALAVHGSLARDLDLIGIPWTEKVSKRKEVLREILREYAVRLVGRPERKNHRRIVYTLACGWGECAIDLNFLI